MYKDDSKQWTKNTAPVPDQHHLKASCSLCEYEESPVVRWHQGFQCRLPYQIGLVTQQTRSYSFQRNIVNTNFNTNYTYEKLRMHKMLTSHFYNKRWFCIAELVQLNRPNPFLLLLLLLLLYHHHYHHTDMLWHCSTAALKHLTGIMITVIFLRQSHPIW